MRASDTSVERNDSRFDSLRSVLAYMCASMIGRLMDYLLNRYKPVAPFLQLLNNSRKSLNNVLPWISNLNISPVVKQNDLLTLSPL